MRILKHTIAKPTESVASRALRGLFTLTPLAISLQLVPTLATYRAQLMSIVEVCTQITTHCGESETGKVFRCKFDHLQKWV